MTTILTGSITNVSKPPVNGGRPVKQKPRRKKKIPKWRHQK